TAGRRLRHSPAFSCPAGRVGPKALNAIRQLFPIRPSAGEFRLLVPELPSMLIDILKAAFLGIVEGLTEYIPVSSTGHLLLLQHFFGFGDEDFGNTFAVLIQLGAILALLSIYFTKLWHIAIGLISDPNARRRDRGVVAQLHQGRTVQSLDRLLQSDRRRCGAALCGQPRSAAAPQRR